MRLLRWTSFVSAAALLAVLGAPFGHAQTRRPMTLLDLMAMERLVDPQLSADGTRVMYQLNHADWKADRRVGHIWTKRVTGGAPVQLTFGENGETFPRWAPDGKTILFVRDGQIQLLPADGGEARTLTKHATGVSSPAWAPDGSAAYFLALDPKTNEEKEHDRLKDDLFSFEDNPKQRQLWKATVATGAEQKLTDGDLSVLDFRLSRDGRRVMLQRAPSTSPSDAYRGEVWMMDANGENARALTHNEISENEAQLSPDNSQVMFLAEANQQLESYYNQTIFLEPAAGGAPRLLVPDFPYEIEHAAWAPDGRSIFAVVNMGVHSEIFQIDLNGRPKQLTDGRHSIPPGGWTLVAVASQIVFQFDEPTRFGDVWTLPLSGGTPVRVTDVYDSLDRDFRLPRQEKIAWKGADGVAIEGLLIYPLEYEAGKRYPLVVQLHGGPQTSDRFGFAVGSSGWNEYVQVLTAKGYAILRPNYRGSSGYGNAFLRDPIGGYFKNMHLDVIAGVDALVTQGIADPDRLAVMGWSAGGHLVNKLITFTDRFKAASAGAGAADWTSMYAQTDQRAPWRAAWFGGTPYQPNAPIDTYWNQSPLKYVANVKTPTLFIVGQDDQRVPMPQSVEMYRALKANGVPTRLYVAPREGHNWIELRHQLNKANVELEWFERYVTGRAYVAEKAPAE